ncbi:cytochrome P450 [Aquabacterium sp. A7-Y]|uniref:cytochrome P450 n=1 Tax=Aquabacterium sp. A7-Y TaxID=1349605 RepID=UPI00223DDCAF|nr:cytochrome P450 [Aquabacterium sp. A7-Y]MCW7539223.1 cytochrome P450 [Aquabacterium sp. A7-Y]
MNDEPLDPLQAVSAPDPYAYYRRLRERQPFYFDESVRMWVASSAAVVEALLADDNFTVRPAGQPVPPALAGSAAGELFGRLVRMNEGPAHAAARPALGAVLGGWEPATAAAIAQREARAALKSPGRRVELLHRVPLLAVAELLGVPSSRRLHVAAQVDVFVACLSPQNNAVPLEAAATAAGELTALFGEGLGRWAPVQAAALTPEVFAANLAGLLVQTCDASAGLVGNCLVALAREPEVLADLQGARLDVGAFVAEVARHDPAIQNTRRHAARATSVAGARLQAGEAVLLLLAAANRDPACGEAAEGFDPRRPAHGFGFGSGRHRCPGEALARAVAGGVVLACLEQVDAWLPSARRFLAAPVYRNSVNARIPRFDLPVPAGTAAAALSPTTH